MICSSNISIRKNKVHLHNSTWARHILSKKQIKKLQVSILQEWPPYDIFALWHAIMTFQRCSNKQGTPTNASPSRRTMAILEQRGPVPIHCEFGRIVCWQKEIMTLDWHCMALYLFWDLDFNKEGASQHSLLGLTSSSVFLFILLPWLDFRSVIYILYHTVGDSLNDLKSESSWLHIFHMFWEHKCSVG